MRITKVHIGKVLVDNKVISQDQLDQAIAYQRETGERFGQALTSLKFIKEEQLLQLLSQQLEVSYINLKNYPLKEEIVNLLPEFYARHFRAIVLKKETDGLLVGMVDPQDLLAYDEMTRLFKQPIRIALVSEAELLPVIEMMYRRTAEISNFAEELSEELGKNDFNLAQLGNDLPATDAPVVKLLQSIFEEAVQMNASDIHIEPDENILRIRKRVDGVLHEQIIREKGVIQALTLRLKLMAGINITEKRLPQDGRFSIAILGKNFDVRLSTLPVHFGESVVMRLLNQSTDLLNLAHIGMPEPMLQQLKSIISMPNGLLLITGPTGSGKTTTLYGALSELNNAGRKIITVEDPVEYRLPRVNQVQVLPAIDLSFARALRAILRQDPDIIMVGELRDQETVAIALRAAMTGHLVLSTLHTNDAISSTLRLLDMGAENYLVAAVLRGIIAQRLVRRICKNCVRDVVLKPHEEMWLSNTVGPSYTLLNYKEGIGCTYCHHTGYKGQIGVFELLVWNAELADALCQNNPIHFSSLAHRQETFKPLALSGLDFALQGITTISEVIRIAGESTADIAERVIHHTQTETES